MVLIHEGNKVGDKWQNYNWIFCDGKTPNNLDLPSQEVTVFGKVYHLPYGSLVRTIGINIITNSNL